MIILSQKYGKIYDVGVSRLMYLEIKIIIYLVSQQLSI